MVHESIRNLHISVNLSEEAFSYQLLRVIRLFMNRKKGDL